MWKAGRNAKRMRATFRERPVVLITSVGPEEVHRWKDAVTTGAEIASWIGDGATHGLRPWFTKFNGCVPDDRWVQPVVDAFALHAAMEPVLHAMAPTAEIAILDPATTLRHWAAEDRAHPRGRRIRILPRADRGQAAVRIPLRPGDDRRGAGPFQGGDPRQCHLPVGRPVPDAGATTSPAAAPSSRPASRRSRDEDNRPRATPGLAELFGIR